MGANICEDYVPGCHIRKRSRCSGDHQSWLPLSVGRDSDLHCLAPVCSSQLALQVPSTRASSSSPRQAEQLTQLGGHGLQLHAFAYSTFTASLVEWGRKWAIRAVPSISCPSLHLLQPRAPVTLSVIHVKYSTLHSMVQCMSVLVYTLGLISICSTLIRKCLV